MDFFILYDNLMSIYLCWLKEKVLKVKCSHDFCYLPLAVHYALKSCVALK
jgi:hypothetical protein